MSAPIQALVVLLPVAYLAAALLYAMHFGGPDAPTVRVARRLLLVFTLLLHSLFFLTLGSELERFPVHDAWTTVSSMALVISALYGLISFRISHVGAGVIVIGAAALLQLSASAFGDYSVQVAPAMPGGFYILHAVTSLFAASALVLSGIHGFLYLILFRRMQRRQFGPLVRRLPSLRALTRLTRRSALAGFLLLTIGINVGIAWAHMSEHQEFRYTDPWVLAMLAIWLHFGLVAFSRSIPGLNARRASYAAALGLSVFLLMSLVSLIPEASFHWKS